MKTFEDLLENNQNLQAFMDDMQSKSEFYQRGIGFFMTNFPVIIDAKIFSGKIYFSIVSEDKNKGVGNNAMKWFTELADKHQVVLTCFIKPFGNEKGLSKKQLFVWYKKFGFKKTRGDDMDREPI